MINVMIALPPSDYWYCPHSMRNKVYVTVRRPSVCLLDCLSNSLAAAACGGFVAVHGPRG